MDPSPRSPEWIKALRELAILCSEAFGLSGLGVLGAYLIVRQYHFSSIWIVVGGLSGLTLSMVRLYLRQQKK